MLVSWDVSIDMPAGPSEVMIYAEGAQRGDWVALDVLAQAEHDPRARAIVVTADRVFAEALKAEVERMAAGSPRREILEKSLQNAAIVVVADRQEAIKAINMMAPEHLQIAGDDLEEMVAQVRNAGAVFIGETTPWALGDYSVGTNHVLPTMGWARRASPLSVRDFLRTREYIRCTKEGLGSIANDAVIIATAEGLLNHARSVSARLDGGGTDMDPGELIDPKVKETLRPKLGKEFYDETAGYANVVRMGLNENMVVDSGLPACSLRRPPRGQTRGGTCPQGRLCDKGDIGGHRRLGGRGGRRERRGRDTGPPMQGVCGQRRGDRRRAHIRDVQVLYQPRTRLGQDQHADQGLRAGRGGTPRLNNG
jgi:hypothetical protein